MNLQEATQLLIRLYGLINRESTGTPEELARRLDKSVSTIHRYIGQLKDLGIPIEYCPHKRSYYFTEKFEYKIV